ncbi:hypothetical protein PVAP13_3NG248760 [Panicum virgatum]|uniref:Uncharacterized protein n=1 Tax=Panicum virgatum TaxID=38727 RepID=A0A8T0U4E2_PANVG|nr:hypothetical protein PVAP13_3NG248760 [Panicum virgatum]
MALLAIFPFDGVVACRSHTPFSLDRSMVRRPGPFRSGSKRSDEVADPGPFRSGSKRVLTRLPTWSLPVWL